MVFSLAATVWGNGFGLAATFEHNCAGCAADARAGHRRAATGLVPGAARLAGRPGRASRRMLKSSGAADALARFVAR
jgi:hypothetical protein